MTPKWGKILPKVTKILRKYIKIQKNAVVFPCFFIVLGWSFRRQSTSQMLIWYKLWGMIYHIALFLSSSSVSRLPTCPFGGTLFSEILLPTFLFCLCFCFSFVLFYSGPEDIISAQRSSKESNERSTHCCVHPERWVPTPPQRHGNPPATPPVLPILGVTVAPMQPRFDADETTKKNRSTIAWKMHSDTRALRKIQITTMHHQ